MAPCRAPCEWNILARSIILLRQSYGGTSVMDRGDRWEHIFINDVDRQDFRKTLKGRILSEELFPPGLDGWSGRASLRIQTGLEATNPGHSDGGGVG
jgi:hypothetical protein